MYFDRDDKERWSKNYIENINAKNELKQYKRLQDLREEREIINKVHKDLENEKIRKEMERISKIKNVMSDYKESVELKKLETMRKRDDAIRDRDLRTSLDINSDEKNDKLKKHLNKLNDNIDKNMEQYKKYLEQVKLFGPKMKTNSPSKILSKMNDEGGAMINQLNLPSYKNNELVHGYVNRQRSVDNIIFNRNRQQDFADVNQKFNNPNGLLNEDYNNNGYINKELVKNISNGTLLDQISRPSDDYAYNGKAKSITPENMSSGIENPYNSYNDYRRPNEAEFYEKYKQYLDEQIHQISSNTQQKGDRDRDQYQLQSDIQPQRFAPDYQNFSGQLAQPQPYLDKQSKFVKDREIEERSNKDNIRAKELQELTQQENSQKQIKMNQQQNLKMYLDSQVNNHNKNLSDAVTNGNQSNQVSQLPRQSFDNALLEQSYFEKNHAILIKPYNNKKYNIGESVISNNPLTNPIPDYKYNRYIYKDLGNRMTGSIGNSQTTNSLKIVGSSIVN